MITKMSHAALYVLDQDEAKDFYANKLGFEVRNDVTMGDFRWLTVAPPEQPDLEITLMPIKPNHVLNDADVKQVRELVKKGAMGSGVFNTSNCQATYEELKAKGVEFISPPTERPYGIEATFKDNSGNWFSLTQRLSQ
ncbi:MAG: VOC family protein [Cyclobacteriaceae bacterium]